MILNSENILDFMMYVTYPEKVAIAILINNTLNMHIREDNVLSYMHEPYEGKYRLTVNLDKDIRDNDYGETYHGTVRVIYDKIDASVIYPNGFFTNKHVGSSEFSVPSLLDLLHRNTKVLIREADIDLIDIDGQAYLEFKDEALFWKGHIKLRSVDSIEYYSNEVVQ